jgi:putative ABC transport system permease protein
MLREISLDLRFASRMMRRSPGFTIVALLTMALGIGAATAMFSIVDGVILRPLPYPEANRIVLLQESNPSRGWSTFSVAPLNLWDWQERNRSLELLAAYQRASAIYTGGDEPRSLDVYRASDGFLEILGGQPVLGRGITHEDVQPGAPAVVVLSHGFWMRVFGGDPAMLGRMITLDGVPHTVVGILPEDWRPFSRTPVDLVVPLKPDPFWYTHRGSHFLYGLGRLRPGVTLAQAQSDLSSIAAALEREHPDTNEGWGVVVRPLKDVMLGSTGSQLPIFMAAVALVLLIACANLANMMLARVTGRTRELAIRTAVGAAASRVARQLLVESVLLAFVGGMLGVVLAFAVVRVFVAGWPTMLPRMHEIGLNTPVLLFSLGLTLVSGVLFGLAPSLAMARSNPGDVLRQGGGIAGDRSRRWLRAALVAGEVGLAVMLLVGCGLLVRSLSALKAQDPGFRTTNRLVFSTPLPQAKYGTPEGRRAFGDAALARLRALPGVKAAALTSLIPLGPDDNIWGFWVEGHPAVAGREDGSALFYRVSDGYDEAMGLRLVAGRGIDADDRADGPPVAVISESLAKQHFAGQNPVGRHIRFGTDAPLVEIVGVVGDVQHYALGRSSVPQVYVPFQQRPTGNVNFVVEASVPPASLVSGARAAIHGVDPDEPIVNLQVADALVSNAISMPRFRTLIMTGFGFAALLLAVVGLYGMLAYSVSRRTMEIGVRMALGATRGSVVALVFREGGPLVMLGLAVGLAGAWMLSRVLQSMLFGVGARDPLVFIFVPLTLAAVATIAMLVPARRASRVDPVQTLAEG